MTPLILYAREDDQSQVQLRTNLGIVWITQWELTKLFNPSKQNSAKHLKVIFAGGELLKHSAVEESSVAQGKLDQNSTAKDFLVVRQERIGGG